MKPICSIFFHNYYGNHKYWLDFFVKKIKIPSILYYNIVNESIYNLEENINEIVNLTEADTGHICKIIFRLSSNKGKDIGGKMVLLDSYQKLGMETELGLFLHDKKSIYKANNITWANELFKIIEPDFQNKALQLFTENINIGIVAAYGCIVNEFNESLKLFTSNNKVILSLLQDQFKIFPNNFQYVAGTMFWFRMKPISYFLKSNSPLQIRESFESGNIIDQYTGSYTHSWERLLCWIITMQKYKISII